MSIAKRNNPLNEYASVNVYSAADSASPHRIVQMLMEGALSRIAAAKRLMTERKIADKCENITRAMDIVLALQAALDKEIGGKIAETLDALYEYMSIQLLKANVENDPSKLDEVYKLLNTIKQGWDAVPDEYKNANHDELQKLAQPAPAVPESATK